MGVVPVCNQNWGVGAAALHDLANVHPIRQFPQDKADLAKAHDQAALLKGLVALMAKMR